MTRRRHLAPANLDLCGLPGARCRTWILWIAEGGAVHEAVDARLADLQAEWIELRRAGCSVRAALLTVEIWVGTLLTAIDAALPRLALHALQRALIWGAASIVTAGLLLGSHAAVEAALADDGAPMASAVFHLRLPSPSGAGAGSSSACSEERLCLAVSSVAPRGRGLSQSPR